MNDDEIVCNCMSVTVKDIKDAIANGAKSLKMFNLLLVLELLVVVVLMMFNH